MSVCSQDLCEATRGDTDLDKCFDSFLNEVNVASLRDAFVPGAEILFSFPELHLLCSSRASSLLKYQVVLRVSRGRRQRVQGLPHGGH